MMNIIDNAVTRTNMVIHRPSCSHSAEENRTAFYVTALLEGIASELDSQDELESALAAEQEARKKAESLVSKLTSNLARHENRNLLLQLDSQLAFYKQRAEAAEALIKASREQKPIWYAVMSIDAPVVNRAIRSLDVAHEYAAECRENYGGVNIVELYAQPPIPPEIKELQLKIIDLEAQLKK